MIASATAEDYAAVLATVLADPGVDLAMVINVTPILTSPVDVIERVAEVARGPAGAAKPVLAVMMATEEFHERVRHEPGHPPVYHFPESAARAMQRLVRYGAWRRRPADDAVPELPADDTAVAAILDRALAARGPGWLEPDETFALLAAYGVPVARWRLAADVPGARAAAAELGLPVVVKAVAPDLLHKSDVGAVAVDLRTPTEVADALAGMAARLAAAGHRPQGYLVQEMARGGHEVIFGISTDPRFGPLLMFGLGGRYVEVFQDVRFAVTPLRPDEAHDVVRGIRGLRLLEGVRGEPGVDLALLEEVLLRLAQLAVRHPRVRELDVNPFLAAADRRAARALDARVRVEAAA
jgi:acyl-CoA synthetase (NDP forming)